MVCNSQPCLQAVLLVPQLTCQRSVPAANSNVSLDWDHCMVLKMSVRETSGSLSSLQQRPISDSLGNAVSGVMFLGMQKCLTAEYHSFLMLLQIAVFAISEVLVCSNYAKKSFLGNNPSFKSGAPEKYVLTFYL